MNKLKISIIVLLIIISAITVYILTKNNNIRAKAETVEGDSVVQEEEKILGDINGDGIANSEDATECLSIAADLSVNKTPQFEYEHEIADVNGDNEIDANDAAIILEYTAARGSGEDVTIEDILNEEE